MSNLHANTYDWPAAVTPSDTVDDPNGVFSAVYVTAAGTLFVFPYAGPAAAAGIAIPVVANQYLRFPIKRIGVTGTVNATCIGLVSGIYRQGK